MKNILLLLLSIAMVAAGYYFWRGKKPTVTPTNINVKFSKDCALQIVEAFYKTKQDTIGSGTTVDHIENKSFTYKSLDTIVAEYTIEASYHYPQIGGVTPKHKTYNYPVYWKFYYTNGKWNGEGRMTAW